MSLYETYLSKSKEYLINEIFNSWERNQKLQRKLEIQTKRVENLKNFLSQGDELKVIKEWVFRSDSLSRCQAIDQELEKELESLK